MTSTLCIIPARGGSKRIPRKNFLPLAGKPLLAYTIEVAIAAGCFTDVVVSSDDAEILALAESLGAIADRRPDALSGDKTRFVEVIAEYLQRSTVIGRYEAIASLLPTCPFRTVADVKAAHGLFAQHQQNGFLIAVTEYDFPPQLAMDWDPESDRLTMRDPNTYNRTTRSQSLGKAYHPNGAIYLTTVDLFLRDQTFFGDPLIGYVMPPERSLDIDYPYQFQLADYWMAQRSSFAETQ